MSDHILVLYYSRNGATKAMANRIAQGIESKGMQAKLRTVPDISDGIEFKQPSVPEDGDLFVQQADLKACAGLALGSPTRFGNMAAPLKYFLDSTSSQWLSGALVDKPASVFTSTGSMHGGQESTLLSMMLPLLHHGMVLAGLPYTHPELHSTTTGGSPYGATHYAHREKSSKLSDDERALCFAQGQRLAVIAQKLATQ
ncbi:MAG: NAD(P)H quinone oxidoreductase [Alteromonadaceae bacterium]|uniref:NAD(P)H:quinone oxidoreductase n=1 Tax=Paraglaciecola chathamensis TaxID=368405 RepID=UPI000C401964|nr:NAD(P)H:quinone oxidoreductase [Paraglaciecola agarilytica]MBN26558.1 NAD(P)H quinone oxidoreductase [Alteromonadaceae bacterium]|tara:strand:+ start:37708 stop:38304 length:597 start_codon:yes stop_codon:yes gene_type:complete